MIKIRCYWCKKYVSQEIVIRHDGLGFCRDECVVEFGDNNFKPKSHVKKTEKGELKCPR